MSSGPKQFRKKPVVIEAMQYTLESRDEIIEWAGAIATAIGEDGGEYELQSIRIHTLEGDHRADIGDWIIKGVAGEFYPCKPDIFAATYTDGVGAATTEESLLRKLLNGGYADLARRDGRFQILLDTSWLEVTAEEADVANAIWSEDGDV